jgi:hypothetical protein
MKGFKEHRHEQSLYSILVEKYQLPYIDRTSCVEMEFIIPEIDMIRTNQTERNRYRMEEDRKENK